MTRGLIFVLRIILFALRYGDIPGSGFGGNGSGLESLAIKNFERFGKRKPQFPKTELTSFLGTALGELEQSVPTWEDYQHEEELQRSS